MKAIAALTLVGLVGAGAFLASKASASKPKSLSDYVYLYRESEGEPTVGAVQVNSSQGPITFQTYTFPPNDADTQFIVSHLADNATVGIVYMHNRTTGERVPVDVFAPDDFTRGFLLDSFV